MAKFIEMLRRFLRYIRRNPSLGIGVGILLFLVFFSAIGSFIVDPKDAYPLAASARKPPSLEYPLGTDGQGRNLLAVAVAGTWLTLRIGLIAGAIGLGVGTLLGFVSAYYGGVLDTVIRWTVDVWLTVPELMVLVVIASSIGGKAVTVNGMALIISLMAWRWPARTIRAQVLTMRERGYVMMSRLSGMGGLEIIFRELMPNLLPFLGASLVGSVRGAIFASIGLSALGLGPLREPTLGVTIYWVMQQNAFLRGLWWWGVMPVTIVVLILVMLFLISAGLDELANPRVRRTA